MSLLNDKIALVTGGSSGIGRASALAFAREGAAVAIADINAEGGNEVVEQIKASGGEATFILADMSNSPDIEAMVATVVETFGRLDCAFNNAAEIEITLSNLVPTHELPEDVWDRIVSVSLKGVWVCMKHEIAQMLGQSGGSVVNTSSVLGLVAMKNHSNAYMASKHGVIGLTKTAALEYARRNVRVNAICPGAIHTPAMDQFLDHQTKTELEEFMNSVSPMGRMGRPEEIAQAAVWLSSDAASFVTGHSLVVDGGFVSQ